MLDLRGFYLERRVIGLSRSYLTLGITPGPRPVSYQNVDAGRMVFRDTSGGIHHFKAPFNVSKRQSGLPLC